MMSKAMGRSLANVLFSAFGSVVTAAGGADGSGETRTVRTGTPEDIGVLLPTPARCHHPRLRAGRGPGPAHAANWPTC